MLPILRFFFFALLLTASLLVGCNRKTSPPKTTAAKSNAAGSRVKPGEKPIPPLKLDAPPAMPEVVDGQNLKAAPDADTPVLAGLARRSAGTDYNRSAIYQYWYVQKSKRG